MDSSFHGFLQTTQRGGLSRFAGNHMTLDGYGHSQFLFHVPRSGRSVIGCLPILRVMRSG